MKILFVTTEFYPLAKAGGLADAVSSLSVALAERGHDTRIVIPRYYFVDRTNLQETNLEFTVDVGGQPLRFTVYRTPYRGATVYLLDCESVFGRDGIYGPNSGGEFPDNALRFAALCRAALSLPRFLNWHPDVIHGHDWPTGLLPVYFRLDQERDRTERTKTPRLVFSIHNIGYQGTFSLDVLHPIGIRPDQAHRFNVVFDGRVNFLNAGIAQSDLIATVSPRYAQEILSPQFAFGLESTLSRRKRAITGILNGIDTYAWDPKTDATITTNFSSSELTGKTSCKASLQKELGLPVDAGTPVVGMVTRLVDQKGIGALFGPGHGSAWRICTELPVQVVVLGSGDAWCESELRALSARLPNLKVTIGYDNSLAHQIEAGSDFFLMPSVYEPCGLNQMYSMRYGTVPIVTRTGGLADTVDGTVGFHIQEYSPDGIFTAVKEAVHTFRNDPDRIHRMKLAGMNRDFSWDHSAAQYEEVYRNHR